MLSPLTGLFRQLSSLLGPGGAETRYLKGSDELAIATSKLGMDGLSLDPLTSECARSVLELLGDPAVALASPCGPEALRAIHEHSLSLLRASYFENRLIRSTLLGDMIPALLEAYARSPLVSSTWKGSAPSPLRDSCSFADVAPAVPLPLAAVLCLLQAGPSSRTLGEDPALEPLVALSKLKCEISNFLTQILQVG